MRSLITIALVASAVTIADARRWRFAVPFPGKVESTIPEPLHRPFDDIEEKEKLFDAKEVSRWEHKVKIAVEEAADDKTVPINIAPPKNLGSTPRMPWML